MSSNYEIWIMQEGKEAKGFQLPVNPEDYSYTQGTNDKTVSRVGAEPAILKMGKAPHTLSFSSYFPASASDLDILEISPNKLKSPATYVKLINSYKESKLRVHVTITGAGIDDYFKITSFKTAEKGGDVGTVYYDISFRTCPYIGDTEYLAEYGVGGTMTKKPAKYKVVKGDTWQTIAKKFYGSTKKAIVDKLKKANKKKGKVVKLKAGITIKLP